MDCSEVLISPLQLSIILPVFGFGLPRFLFSWNDYHSEGMYGPTRLARIVTFLEPTRDYCSICSIPDVLVSADRAKDPILIVLERLPPGFELVTHFQPFGSGAPSCMGDIILSPIADLSGFNYRSF